MGLSEKTIISKKLQEAKCIAMFWMVCPHSLGSCYFLGYKELCSICDIQDERQKKKIPGETAEDVGPTAEYKMLRLMKSMVCEILTEMRG